MKRLVPLLIASVGGFALIVAYFLPATEGWGVELAVWFDILASIAFILGGGNLLKVHLQKVQDKKAGWGYSGIILVSFLLTLFFGLTKLGSHPSENTEFSGESFVPLPVSALPTYSVPRPTLAGEALPTLPPSVVRQFSVTPTELTFQGWPTPVQGNDLDGLRPELAWKCAVEQLVEKAAPAPPLAGRLRYYADHRSLSFEGYLSPAEEAAIRQALPDAPPAAFEALAAAARKSTSRPMGTPPAAWKIPDSAAPYVEYNGRELTVRGPITPGLRKNLADTWAHWPQMRPHSAPQRQAARAALEAAGQPLSESQQKAFEKAFDALWTPAQLRAALDIAGVPAPKEKTACECFADQQNGVNPIERQVPPTTPAVVLNPEQIAVLERLAFDPAIAEADFLAELQKAGPLTPAQVAAFSKFLRAAPTVGTFERDLYFSLRQEGPLTKQQQDQLLGNFQKEFQWRQGVGELFAAAHVPKYPWSGDYTEPGTPFWWVYLYILQPLMTSTFAMLAFYVASAAFRAFRAKNLEATLLLITAFIVLLRSTPLGAGLSSLLPESLAFLKLDAMTAFIMKVPNTAGNRAIMIGIALGIAATSLKVLLGLDRSYLGSDD